MSEVAVLKLARPTLATEQRVSQRSPNGERVVHSSGWRNNGSSLKYLVTPSTVVPFKQNDFQGGGVEGELENHDLRRQCIGK